MTLQVDASIAGLGAALNQEHGPVAFASKAMNETQCRYAQIEKELLAVVFARKRFHQYVYGKHITTESNHKPLEAIFKKPLSQAPSRLQKNAHATTSLRHHSRVQERCRNVHRRHIVACINRFHKKLMMYNTNT